MQAILFHIGLGLLASFYRPAILLYVLAVFLFFCFRIFREKDKLLYVLLAIAYFAGAEVFFRMTKAYIFYETGKYAVVFFAFLGMFFLGFKRKSFPFLIFFLLLLPAVWVSFDQMTYDSDFRRNVAFNLSGPVCLCVASVFTFGRTVYLKDFLKILDYILYPILSMTVYIVLYAPGVREVIDSTASNVAVSGGYGPNQVATVLGLGFFILLTRFFIPYKNVLVQSVMMFFLFLTGYRALLTFSRGGVLVAAVMGIVFLIILYRVTGFKTRVKTGFRIVTLSFALLALWGFTIFQTGGLIENRYANQDALGREKEDITTGRVALLETEIDAFKKSPVFGVGVGRVKTYFETELGMKIATHNEVSRLLSEHGAFGILALTVLIFTPVYSKLNGRKNIFFWPFLIFWFLTIAHSSMRIAAPAVIYALSLLNIKYENKETNSLYRK